MCVHDGLLFDIDTWFGSGDTVYLRVEGDLRLRPQVELSRDATARCLTKYLYLQLLLCTIGVICDYHYPICGYVLCCGHSV